MNCDKCGEDVADGSRVCGSCGYEFEGGSDIEIITSRLAITALVLGILSIMWGFSAALLMWGSLYLICGILVLGSIVTGIIAIVSINKNGGRLTGGRFAKIGIVVPILLSVFLGIHFAAVIVRHMEYRMLCGTNMSGIGKLMLVYSTDNDEEFPVAGGRNAMWSKSGAIADLDAKDEETAFGYKAGNSVGQVTISSSLYLLVKYADANPKQFVCKAESGVNAFELSDSGIDVDDIIDLWDFGDDPGAHVSYSYHLPYSPDGKTKGFAVSALSKAATPVCADRNPFMDRRAAGYLWGARMFEGPPRWKGGEYQDPDGSGNAAMHNRDGQHVLYVDGHADFQRFANVGLDNDNIWKYWPESVAPSDEVRQVGVGCEPLAANSGPGIFGPKSEVDAFLVNERRKGK